MLKLRKVEIVGFKSFCERTIVTFSGSGTTCIVGPNGCGKSNVVDAISWVLGEQSHKSLRAERMADCIFNGTVKRPPLGLAEVTITMEDPELAEAARFVMASAEIQVQEGAVDQEAAPDSNDANGSTEILSLVPAQALEPVEGSSEGQAETPVVPDERFKRRKKATDKPVLATRPGEVVISRRLYRSGQSEYLINGRTGRLRDIQEMFMGVGLGPDSYAIIEQGRIGLILSTKPMERRAIIEEAAGVTKFKTKKRLAEAKLDPDRCARGGSTPRMRRRGNLKRSYSPRAAATKRTPVAFLLRRVELVLRRLNAPRPWTLPYLDPRILHPPSQGRDAPPMSLAQSPCTRG